LSAPVYSDSGLAVIDGVLSSADFASLHEAAAEGRYRSVHRDGWDKAWRRWDGEPLRGEGIYYDPTNRFDWRGARYPTGSPLDLLVETLRSFTSDHPEIVGVEGSDWDSIFLSPWIYPVGSALSPHCDADHYSGSFTYFLHAVWSPTWGGELIVYDEGSNAAYDLPREGGHPWLSGFVGQLGGGIDRAIFPAPNRLALLGRNRIHRIARVDPNAGTHVRLSIAGFFFRIAAS
jgi:hypothetical protein